MAQRKVLRYLVLFWLGYIPLTTSAQSAPHTHVYKTGYVKWNSLKDSLINTGYSTSKIDGAGFFEANHIRLIKKDTVYVEDFDQGGWAGLFCLVMEADQNQDTGSVCFTSAQKLNSLLKSFAVEKVSNHSTNYYFLRIITFITVAGPEDEYPVLIEEQHFFVLE